MSPGGLVPGRPHRLARGLLPPAALCRAADRWRCRSDTDLRTPTRGPTVLFLPREGQDRRLFRASDAGPRPLLPGRLSHLLSPKLGYASKGRICCVPGLRHDYSVHKLEKGIGGCYPIRLEGRQEGSSISLPVQRLSGTWANSRVKSILAPLYRVQGAGVLRSLLLMAGQERSDIPAHPGFESQAVQEVRHNAEPGEREEDGGGANEAGEVEPIGL